MCTAAGRFTARFLAAFAAVLVISCSSPTGPDVGGATRFTGRGVVTDSVLFAIVAQGEFTEDGRLRAQLNWRVVEPGRGSLANQPPDLLLEFRRNCPGWQCPGYASAGPAAAGPLSVTADVHPVSSYFVRILSRRSCGGCQIEYALDVEHPKGSLQLLPAATCPVYTLYFPLVTGPQPIIDPSGSPPQVRMRVGERVLIAPRASGCDFTPAFQVMGWSSTDTGVAAVEDDGRSAYLKAERVGQTRVTAEIAHIDGSRVQAELGYCPSGSNCIPVRLVLNVVR